MEIISRPSVLSSASTCAAFSALRVFAIEWESASESGTKRVYGGKRLLRLLVLGFKMARTFKFFFLHLLNLKYTKNKMKNQNYPSLKISNTDSVSPLTPLTYSFTPLRHYENLSSSLQSVHQSLFHLINLCFLNCQSSSS